MNEKRSLKKRLRMFGDRGAVVFCTLLTFALLAVCSGQAFAGAGVAQSTYPDGRTVPTYYVNSPAGDWPDWRGPDPAHPEYIHHSGTALQKFVDPLPNMCQNTGGTACTSPYIPIAFPDTSTYPGSNYFEIAIVQYWQQMHSNLPIPTRLRGYVQLETPANAANSRHVQLFYDQAKTQPILVNGQPVFAVDNPTYLGPIIITQKGTPVRVKYMNLLPVGSSGDLFIPSDKTLMGAGLGPDQTTYYTENRTVTHLHGGDTPWISDGTPWQWTTPVGETSKYNVGATIQTVPDMPDPGLGHGAGTLYYTNDISGRLMFYHDHAVGITRLNVYAGLAAGYLITDPSERALVPNAPEIPLVIQDKTFVPSDIMTQDAKWDTSHWGHYGDLWFPNVYEFNQDPNSGDGTNPPGRWDYGPYFWPIFPVAAGYNIPPGNWDVANNRSAASTTPEAFMDTPLVNGVAYPYLTVEPKTYRFRILNAANDRFFNLGLYKAVNLADCSSIAGGSGYKVGDTLTFTGGLDPAIPGAIGAKAVVTAVDATGAITGAKMVTFGTAYLSAPTGMTTTGLGTGASFACAVTTGNTEMAMVPFDSTGTFPTTGGLMGTGWGTPVSYIFPMGVPSPLTVGPDIIQIGSEGGLLPSPVDIPSTPINYEYNKRSVTVLNVLEHGLFLGPAERADILVDFSRFAGKTLIMYNDSPAPVPAGDDRNDYYTGDPDFTASGGMATTHPGYGPDIRTIMQIRVAPTATTPSAMPATLSTDVSAAYAATQPKPVVAETAYFPAFGAPNTADAYPRIATGSAYGPYFTFVAGSDFSFYDYATPPVIPQFTPIPFAATITNVTMGSTVSVPVRNKAIQELFDPWGRMNATLGTEVPFTNQNNQTTVPLGYVDPGVVAADGTVIDPATETIKDGETQIWKITHNGVDTHPVHVHLINWQVLDRVGWDGTVKPPPANEVGWKETVRMNPLEDVYVAVRANKPSLPFGVPNSSRPLAPAEPLGSTMGFINLDPATGNPFVIITAPGVVTNQVSDFGWEYVWHCHILGHEENDFMRPFVFKVTSTVPAAPVLTATLAGTTRVNLSWTDGTPVNYATHTGFGSSANEIGYYIMRSANGGAFQQIGSALANATTYSDTTIAGGNSYAYQVVAYNTAGSAMSNTQAIGLPVTSVTITSISPASPQAVGTTVTFNVTSVSGSSNVEYQLWWRNPVTGIWSSTAYGAAPLVWNTTGLPVGTYSIQVWARNVGSTAKYEAYKSATYVLLAASPVTSITITSATPPSPTAVGVRPVVTFNTTITGGSGNVEYQVWWRNPVTGVWSSTPYAAAPVTWNTAGLPAGTYSIQVWARNVGSTARYEAYRSTTYTLR